MELSKYIGIMYLSSLKEDIKRTYWYNKIIAKEGRE